LQTATQLSKKTDINLLLLGGNVQYNTTATTGSFTTRQLELFHFDIMLCSCAAVVNNECYERSIEQTELKRAAFSRSERHVLLIDYTKFTSFGTYCTAKLADFNLVVTDRKPPETVERKGKNFIY
jgi:DeoR/GlpR family transcriptional regulator of sugar metabolism